MPSFEIEDKYHGKIVAGVDEAGLGPMAGPIVVCACIIQDRKNIDNSINDSKKLSISKRENLFEKIIREFTYGISIVDATVINEHGLSYAWQKGVCESVMNLPIKPDVCLIDGNRKVEIQQSLAVESVVKGDSKSYSIAAASIIAKVTRDRIMQEIHKEYSEYGFDRHVGYCTKSHIEALYKYGLTPYHRKSYAPVRLFLEKTNVAC